MAMFICGFASCDSKKSVSLKTEVDSVSYLIGASYGHGLKQNFKTAPGDPINVKAMVAGFNNFALGDDSLFLGKTEQELQEYVNGYFTRAQNAASLVTKEEGEQWLAQNKGKSGVITTPSGLQYQSLTEGTGIKPELEDTVVVHYTGKLITKDGIGETFDSSVDRGEPARFAVNQVIQGWQEGIQIMPAGSKYMFWIPSELAYGDRGNPSIKPNSALQFEVELLEVLKKKK